jgi:hypothetical protein
MPALNYTVFIDKVESGEKRQTIRSMRKRQFKVGDVLSHYTGMRTKKCRKIRPDTICTGADEITMTQNSIKVSGKPLEYSGAFKLAKADGFDDVFEFMQFFKNTHGFPFVGQIIKW